MEWCHHLPMWCDRLHGAWPAPHIHPYLGKPTPLPSHPPHKLCRANPLVEVGHQMTKNQDVQPKIEFNEIKSTQTPFLKRVNNSVWAPHTTEGRMVYCHCSVCLNTGFPSCRTSAEWQIVFFLRIFIPGRERAKEFCPNTREDMCKERIITVLSVYESW